MTPGRGRAREVLRLERHEVRTFPSPTPPWTPLLAGREKPTRFLDLHRPHEPHRFQEIMMSRLPSASSDRDHSGDPDSAVGGAAPGIDDVFAKPVDPSSGLLSTVERFGPNQEPLRESRRNRRGVVTCGDVALPTGRKLGGSSLGTIGRLAEAHHEAVHLFVLYEIVYFENSQCTHCGHALAYFAERAELTALEPAEARPRGPSSARPSLKKAASACAATHRPRRLQLGAPEADPHASARPAASTT